MVYWGHIIRDNGKENSDMRIIQVPESPEPVPKP